MCLHRLSLMLSTVTGVVLLLVLSETHSFLNPIPSTEVGSRLSKTTLAMTPSPSSEGSVDAQAQAIIAELQAGTKTM